MCKSVYMSRMWFEGVCLNYRNPDPRRGEPRVGSAPDVAFWWSMVVIRWFRFRTPWGSQMLVFTMVLALFPGIGDLLFVKVAFRAPKVTSSRKGTAHRQNLYTQTPDSPHACGRLVNLWFLIEVYHLLKRLMIVKQNTCFQQKEDCPYC